MTEKIRPNPFKLLKEMEQKTGQAAKAVENEVSGKSPQQIQKDVEQTVDDEGKELKKRVEKDLNAKSQALQKQVEKSLSNRGVDLKGVLPSLPEMFQRKKLGATDGFDDGEPDPADPAPNVAAAGLRGVTLPPRTTPQTLVVNGVTIETNGVCQTAVDEAVRIVKSLVTRPDIQATFAKRHVTYVLIPADVKMTDLPEFTPLRGTKTFDGRMWDDVRGSGGMGTKDGKLVVGVAEETLANLPNDGYPPGYSVGLHELAHIIQNVGLPDAERKATIDEFNKRKAAGGPFTDAYGGSNYMEDFAQMSCAYFGKNDLMGKNGAAWIKQNAPARYALLRQIYGPPPGGDPPDAPVADPPPAPPLASNGGAVS